MLALICDLCSRHLRLDDASELYAWVHVCRPSAAVASMLESDAMAEEPDADRAFAISCCSLECAIEALTKLEEVEAA